MSALAWMAIILVLYHKQTKYDRLIDDPVPRDGYLYELPRKVKHTWYDQRRSLTSVLTNIMTFIAVCGYIHILFGWKAALLYAVFPLNVCGVAWITGNYYMSTVLLTLAGIKTLEFGMAGMTGYVLFLTASLNSTLISLAALPISIIYAGTLAMPGIFPLIMFFYGKRFRVGIRQRADKHEEMGADFAGFKWDHFRFVPVTLAYYIYLSFYPVKLGFFHEIGKKREHQTRAWMILSLIVCIAWGTLGLTVDWQAIICWFLAIGVFSQIVMYGQFIAERYTLLANVFFCVIASQILTGPAFWIISTLWFTRSLSYIPAWKTNERLFAYGTSQFPCTVENWTNLSSYYLERGRKFDAIKPLLMAERVIEGDKFGVTANIAACYADCGFYEKAYEWITKAINISPKDKIKGLMEDREELERRIKVMIKGKETLKKMGVIT